MTLCDAGPLVALIDADDPYHALCVTASASLQPEPMITTWPCLTEAMYFLYRADGITAQNELWSYLSDGVLQVYLPYVHEWHRLEELMNKYADMPLDMADASLISAAERLNDRRLFSMDQHLRAVRIHGSQFFDVVP